MTKLLSIAIPALALAPVPAMADPIDLTTLIGSWDIQDYFGEPGDFFENTYYAPVAITAKFTDLYVIGDEYNIFINGVIFASALSPIDDGTYLTDPDAAYDSGKFTRGLIYLQAGDTLSFQILTIPDGYPDGTIAVTALEPAGVPEPAAWGMLIGGFALAGSAVRHRARVKVTYA
ncbi:PEPxxWA-CTERM sorting domain-containing protein [Sphingomonas sp. RS6]